MIDNAYEYYKSNENVRQDSIKNWCNRILILLVMTLVGFAGYILKGVLVEDVDCEQTTSITTDLANVSSPANEGDNVLVIWSETNNLMTSKALVTNFNGNVKQIQWSTETQATAFTKCSILFQDKIYFLG